MKIKDYQTYKQMFIDGVMMTQNVDYADRRSVRKNNRGVVQYRYAATMIAQHYPNEIDDFSSLMSEGGSIGLCAAICLVEIMPCDIMLYERGIAYVKSDRDALDDDSLERYTLSLWLKRHDSK